MIDEVLRIVRILAAFAVGFFTASVFTHAGVSDPVYSLTFAFIAFIVYVFVVFVQFAQAIDSK